MTILHDVTFEDNVLYQRPVRTAFDYVFSNGPKIEVLASAAQSGSYGLAVTPITNTTRFACGGRVIANPSVQKAFRQRFYLNPNGVSIPTGTLQLRIARQMSHEYTWAGYTMWLGYNGSAYTVTLRGYNGVHEDVEINTTSAYTLTSGWNRIEIAFKAAVSGLVQGWVNGTSIGQITGDNHDVAISLPVIGLCFPATTGLTVSGGPIYFDNWRITDDPDTEIGA